MSRFRYLNGMDWVIKGLEQSIHQTVGAGNGSQLVFELDGKLEAESFRSLTQHYVSSFPVLHGRVVRGWQLAPAWKIPRRIQELKVSVKTHILPEDASFEAVVEKLGQCIVVPPGTRGRYVGFNVLYVIFI